MSLLRSRAAQLAGAFGVCMMLFFAFGLPSEEQTKQWSENITTKLQMKMSKKELEEVPSHLRDVYNATLGVCSSGASLGIAETPKDHAD